MAGIQATIGAAAEAACPWPRWLLRAAGRWACRAVLRVFGQAVFLLPARTELQQRGRKVRIRTAPREARQRPEGQPVPVRIT